MKLCYVTDRKALPGTPDAQIRLLLEMIDNAARAGVEWIQIREKELEARQLLLLAQEAKRRARASCRIFVNDHLDVALAAGADGVHLGERSLPVTEVKRFLRERGTPGEFLVGVSTHTVRAVEEAEANGADYVYFGPIFATPSKLAYGPPQGIEQLAAACRAASVPVIAIGGITIENAHQCVAAGAAGIAAIRLFQEARAIESVVRALRTE